MFKLPVPSGQFKKTILGGSGEFEASTDGDAWDALINGNQPFTKDVDAIADVSLSAGSDFAIGAVNNGLSVKLSGKVGHQAQILFSDRDADLLKQYGISLDAAGLYARLVMMTEASAAASVPVPAGAAQITVGVGVGGHLAYERWIRQDAITPAGTVLRNLYGGIQLPQHISTIDELPEAGEVLITRYGGSVNFSSTVGWSHSMTGVQGIGEGRLAPIVKYRARLTAGASFNYALSGEFQIEARRGATDGWVRFVVRKSRDSQTTLAANFGFSGTADIGNVPQSTDEILARLLGAHADRVLDVFDKARTYSDIEKLREAAGDLLFEAIQKYANEALNIALDNATIKEVLTAMHRVVEAYEKIDERIIALYHDVLDATGLDEEIVAGIDVVLGQSTQEDLVKLARVDAAAFQQAIGVLRRIYNDRVFAILQQDAEFAEAVKLLRRIRDFLKGSADADIRKWVATVKQHLPVHGLLTELAKFDTPAEIRAQVDSRLKALVGSIVGKAFAKLEDSEIADALETVGKTLDNVAKFKQKLDEQIKKALHQSFEMKLNVAYARARRNERLLDVEINLAHAAGPQLAQQAANGHFFDVLKNFDSAVVKVNKGVFIEELKESAEIKLNVLGWGFNGITTLVQKSEHTIESEPGGLLHLYASKTELEKKSKSGWRYKEEMRATFAVQALGETFQKDKTEFRPFAVDTLEKMSASYNLRRKDEKTSVEELAEYLQLASDLGLLDVSPGVYASALRDECGGDLGNVDLTYVVRFSTPTLLSAFNLASDKNDRDGGQLGRLARSATRDLLLKEIAGTRTVGSIDVAVAYNNPAVYRLHVDDELVKRSQIGATIPAWITRTTPRPTTLGKDKVMMLNTWFRREDSLVKALVTLDAIVDAAKSAPVDFQQLNEAVRKFLDAGGGIDNDASVFTAVLDRLIHAGSGGTAKRDSAVLLEVTPTKGDNAGKKITRYLAAGPKNPAELAVD